MLDRGARDEDLLEAHQADRIGVARLDVPDFLPPGGLADSPGAKV